MNVDWSGWAVFGLIATAALTGVMISAQMLGLTRLDLPLLLGTLAVEDPDRARVVGFVLHLAVGQAFAVGYAASFTLLDEANWWVGAVLGLVHGGVALTALVPVLPGIHPRMASERAGPRHTAALEPPGPLALNYGAQTPVVAIVAHILYGASLGVLLRP